MLKKMLGKLAVAATFALSVAAHASPVTWTLQNVTFADGGTASGWFVWDAATHTAGAFQISTTGGSVLAGTVYDSTGSGIFGGNPDATGDANGFAWLAGNIADPYLDLIFAASLTDAGGTVSLVSAPDSTHLYGGGYECGDRIVCEVARFVSGGGASADATQDIPEPASIALLGVGLAALGLKTRRKNA